MKMTQRGTKNRTLSLVNTSSGNNTIVVDHYFNTDFVLLASGVLHDHNNVILDTVTGINLTGTQGTYKTLEQLRAFT